MEPNIIRSLFAGIAVGIVAPSTLALIIGLAVVALGVILASVVEGNQ